MKTKIHYAKTLPRPEKFRKSLRAQKVILIYDEKLLSFSPLKSWIESFSDRLGVKAGEELKSLDSLQAVLPVVLTKMQGSSRLETVFVVLGGGSVGDFAGFLASIVKRGVRLVHVPSTWLAAIDSAHGGKTALNVGGFKNQIGTFKVAARIVLVREVLELQSDNDRQSALGELLKIALLVGGPLYSKLDKMKSIAPKDLWRLLPLAVDAKYKIVRKDPFEENGVRHFLNLGHTLAHAYELSERIPHGVAVFEGTKFALRFSRAQKVLSLRDHERVQSLLTRLGPASALRPLAPSRLRHFLLQDKKSFGRERLKFVLLKKIGQPILKSFSVDEVVSEAVRQGVAQ